MILSCRSALYQNAPIRLQEQLLSVQASLRRQGKTIRQWAEEHGVQLEFIKPGKPTQNAFIERFNRTYRTEILDFYLF